MKINENINFKIKMKIFRKIKNLSAAVISVIKNIIIIVKKF
jgi:hypothetical protein